MSVDGPVVSSGLIERIKFILTRPKLEWPVIEAESATIRSVFVPYAVLLAAIGPLASLIGSQLFPIRVFQVVYRPDLLGAMVQALATWGLNLLAVYVLAHAINALAPSFGGTKNLVQAAKVAVYSMTAAWLAAVLGVLPALAWLGGLLGLYSLYLLYLGLPGLMKVPQDKGLIYTIVVVVIYLILWIVVGAIISSVMLTSGLLGAATTGGFYRF